MNWIPDTSGRFHERPYYPQEELDTLSEDWVVSFLRERYGSAEFPISTEDLTIMIECDTSDVDHYADLSSEEEDGEEVHGMTLFYPDRKPAVRIAKELAAAAGRLYRLRTTLTHEFGHVKLHGRLWPFQQARLFPEEEEVDGPKCKRGQIVGGPNTDWMEWQAGYVSGAVLMPVTSLTELIRAASAEWGMSGTIPTSSTRAGELIARVSERFYVSTDAARVRLLQLGYLTYGSRSLPLPLQ